VNGGIEPLGDLPIGGLQRARTSDGIIEFGREARAIGAEGMQLGSQRLLSAIRLAPPFNRGRKRVERARKTSAGGIDGAWLGHSRQYPVEPQITPTFVGRKATNISCSASG